MERWRKPAGVLDIDPSGEVTITSDGRIQRIPTLVLDAETVERMRLGYMCVKCLEPFQVPWPVRCHVCGAPIAREQRAYFEREFAGDVHMGSRVSIEDELASLPERAAQAEREEEP
jgi:hypothetical protein